MRGLSTLVAAAFALGLLVWMPASVNACSSDAPTFREAVRGARAIARVTVVEGFDPFSEDPKQSETYRIERVLKGSLPAVVTLRPAWTSLCHDSVGYDAPEGTTLIVAFDMPYYGATIHPMWGADDAQALFGSAEVPPGITTMAGIEEAIVAELEPPDTSTGAPTEEPGLPLQTVVPAVLIVVAVLVALAVSMRRFRGSSRR